MLEDTICAPATPLINSPIAIVRISGSDSLRAAQNFFSHSKNISPRKAVYGSLLSGNQIIDDVILIYYAAPASYTGEDMIEIFSHGNPLIVRQIIELLARDNIRIAEPGEFSRRAFLNGKMDLTEAEAVNTIIAAKSQWEIGAALDQMHGALRRIVDGLREKAVSFKADIEAAIEFGDEDIEFISKEKALSLANDIREDLTNILMRCQLGEKAAAGFNITITGKPNVGKSSLLNLLLNEERAIVSDIPGTTRDVIRENISIGGIPVKLHDTAGLGVPADEIERIGISRSLKSIDEASVVLVVLDPLQGVEEGDKDILRDTAGKFRIIIINKTDAASVEQIEDIKKETGHEVILFSAKTGLGLANLEQAIVNIINENMIPLKDGMTASVRVTKLFTKALESVNATLELLQQEEQSEIIAFELQSMIDSLGEITGEISPDEILNSIFERFCIGK